MSKCQKCQSENILQASGKSEDLNTFVLKGKQLNERYVIAGCNIGSGDYYSFSVCLDCGQMQGTWPATPDIECTSYTFWHYKSLRYGASLYAKLSDVSEDEINAYIQKFTTDDDHYEVIDRLFDEREAQVNDNSFKITPNF